MLSFKNVANELNATVQNEKDKLNRSFTDKYNNMQKGIQKNNNDISKLNRGLISHRTWGTHSKFVRICNYNANCLWWKIFPVEIHRNSFTKQLAS